MRHLLNTLFITSEDIYLSLDGENVVANREGQAVARYPLHTLSGILSFSYSGASPALMGACAQREIGLTFCTPRGKFLARVSGESSGNVLLRRMQYRMADDPAQSCLIARNMIFGKVYNTRWSMERTQRDHGLRIDGAALSGASRVLKDLLPLINDKETFSFQGRTRRPPLDPFNALLSFSYSLLANDCASALESVGLDSYVGFLHRDRPGRTSLALDLMEELRPCLADRFVLTLVNNRVVNAGSFQYREGGAVLMRDDARRIFLRAWQERKRKTITHPYLGEKLPWGLVPYIQALLLARYIRGDLDAYPPFLWK